MIYIKSIVVISSNNNKFLAISTCINKDLFIILPITKYIYIYINTRLKFKKKKIKHSHNKSTSLVQPTRCLDGHTSLINKTHLQKTQNKSYYTFNNTLQENVLLVTKKFVTKNPAFRH